MSQRLNAIILAYFLMGAMAWGGGALSWEKAGMGQIIIDDPGADDPTNQATQNKLENVGGPIQQAATSISGGLVAVWNIVVSLLAYLFWPIITLKGAGAPAEVWVVGGGTPTIGFYGALIRSVRGST